MRQGGLNGLPFWLQAPSSEITTCNIPFAWSWAIRIKNSRKKQSLKQSQYSKDSHCWGIENALCVETTGMVAPKKTEVKNCWGIEKGSVSKDCKDGFMNK